MPAGERRAAGADEGNRAHELVQPLAGREREVAWLPLTPSFAATSP